MNIQLVQGHFDPAEAQELLSQLVQVKIKFHEGKIQKSHSEEDIKMRENRIKQLQNELHQATKELTAYGSSCDLIAEIKINAS